ncbi:MAG: ABC transporter substrate-binding protein [Bdellovibrionota bacterium]
MFKIAKKELAKLLIKCTCIAIYCIFPLLINAEASKFKVGVISPLSGKAAFIGTAIENGISLAKKDKPDLLSSIDFIFEDSQFENKPAVSAFNKFKSDPKISLIYIFGHGQSHVLAPLAESAKIPLVACSGEAKISHGRNYVIRFFPPHEWLGAKLMDYLRAQGHKNLGMIKSEISNIENIYRGLKSQIKAEESLVVVDEYPIEASDFRTSIVKIKKKNFDALGVFLNQGQIGPFYKQLAELRHSIPTFGTHAMESEEEIKSAGSGIEGAVYPAVTATTDFIARYRNEFANEDYVSFASNAYDFAVFFGELTHDKQTLPKSEQLVESFRLIEDYQGVSGQIKYLKSSEFGDGFIFPVAIKTIKSGKVVTLD